MGTGFWMYHWLGSICDAWRDILNGCGTAWDFDWHDTGNCCYESDFD